MPDIAWQTARVVGCSPGRVRLRFGRPESCQRCLRGDGCGAGVFTRLFSRHDAELELPDTWELTAGDWVRVGIPGHTLAWASLRVHGLPVVAFLAGALPAHWWIGTDPWRDVFALAGGLALALATWRLGRWTGLPRIDARLEPLSCGPSDSRFCQSPEHE